MTAQEKVVRQDLGSLTSAAFVAKWFVETTPFVFGGDAGAHASWKRMLAEGLGTSLFNVTVIGSAALGVSLKPSQNLSAFDNESDIDVAVVSPFHFDQSWRWLRELGPARYGLPHPAQRWVKEHESRLVYWGMIATDQLLPHMPIGSVWLPHLAKLSQTRPADGREVTVRVYRDFDALGGALEHSVRTMRDNLASRGV